MLLEHNPDCPNHLAQLQHYFKQDGSSITTLYRVLCPNCLVARPIKIEEWNGIDRLAKGLTLMNDVDKPA